MRVAILLFAALLAAAAAQCNYDAVRVVAPGSAVTVLNCTYTTPGREMCTAAIGPVFAVPTSGAQRFVVTIRDSQNALATGDCASGCSSLALGTCYNIPSAAYWVAVILECRQTSACSIAMSFVQDAYCGDGVCSAVVENCANCPTDCCPSATPSATPSASASPIPAASQPARTSSASHVSIHAGGAMAIMLAATSIIILLL